MRVPGRRAVFDAEICRNHHRNRATKGRAVTTSIVHGIIVEK